MNAEQLFAHFERISEAPDALPRLRRFILDLAVRGKLVEQDPSDEPAVELLGWIASDKALLANGKGSRKPEVIRPIPEECAPYASPPGWVWGAFGDIIYSRDSERIPVSREERSGRVKLYDYYGASGIIDRIDNFLFDKPLLLIGEDGANLINRSTPIAFIARGKYWVNNHAHVLDGISEEFLRYMELSINATDLKPFVTGTAQPKMNQAKMNSIPIALPPLAEQHRIVAKVDELMSLCDQLEAAKAEREQCRDSLVAASLQGLNQPAEEEETFREQARFTFTNLPRITTRADHIKQLRQTILNLAVRGKLVEGKTGQAASVGDYRSLQNGYAFKSSWFSKSGIRLLRNANIGHDEIRWIDVVHIPAERVPEFERFRLNEGDVVLTLDRPFIATGTKVARIGANDLPCLLLQRVGRFIETSPGLDDDYLFLWINSPHFNEQIDPGRSNGVPHISSKQVAAAKIFVPPLAEQRRIVAKVNELMAICDQLEEQITVTEQDSRRYLESVLAEALAPGIDLSAEAQLA